MVEQIARAHSRLGMTVLCGLLVLAFVGAGVIKLIPVEFEVSNFRHFGYAPWFMSFIGVVEILGAVLILMRPTRLAGSLLLAVVMVGAAASHLRAGDGIAMATPALVLLAILILTAVSSANGLREALEARLGGLIGAGAQRRGGA